ncbi:hypothetical protein [Streptomyces rhizosphaericus]|uniref:Uncharacterized protein n=1 Tax=Streptomyces rhizosphaericus TaxID=114699 RepID=A0A6G4APB9_9ACTN|nr:hypothetical protein [Streptomyces rhizosphaericus]NEW75316.1 hypothetical protein [Streptomyces rhizosphaericus]
MADKKVTTLRPELPRFEEAEGLGPRDAEFVRDLIAVLEKHGNLDRFGLCLLHDHFPLDTDEVLVETNDPKSRTLHIRVEKAGTTRHAKPSQWRFLPNVPHAKGKEFAGGPYQVILQCDVLSLCPGRDR